MNALLFVVPGRPVPKERVRRGFTRQGWPVMYTPRRTIEYAQHVAVRGLVARAEWERANGIPRWPLDRQYEVTVVAYYGNRRSQPDTDNVTKMVKDALQRILWENDRQVVKDTSEARVGIPERLEITVVLCEVVE